MNDSITMTTQSRTERFYELVWPHASSVRHTARALTRGESNADDLSQETMAKAFRRMDALRDCGRVRPWLMTILRHTHIDRMRQERHRTYSLDDVEFDLEDRKPVVPQPMGDANGDVDAVLEEFSDPSLIRALRRLPPALRRTLLLVDVEGRSESEAAEAMGIPVGTVKSRLHRGRDFLRHALRQGTDDSAPVSRQVRPGCTVVRSGSRRTCRGRPAPLPATVVTRVA